MAIDTANKRANTARMAVRFLFISLTPLSGISTEDRTNGAAAYIGFGAAPPAEAHAPYSKIHQGVGFGF